jgi:hypothetical protein
MKINEQELEAHGVSPELIDGMRAIPGEIEHNMIVLTMRLKSEISGLPAAEGEKIFHAGEAAFLARAAIQIPRGGRLEPAVVDVVAAARESVRFERERMRPKSADEVFKPWGGRLDALGWRAAQKTALKGILQEGEEIIAVDHRTATTISRTITQDDLREWTLGQRPKWLVNLPGSMRPSEYLAHAGFPTDEQIDELERTAENVERQQHIRTSGPQHMIGREFR